MEDLYKNCRWCCWFKNDKCLHESTFRGSSIDIRYFSEEGIISEAIYEGFSEQPFSELEYNLESKLSKKKAKEFMQAFYDELEAIKYKWTESIDISVTKALENAVDKDEYAEIIDPEIFCCKYFM